MNAPSELALMIHVEKAVRPLQITYGRRSRIREELLCHLQGIYDEELESCGDSQTAVHAAITRFGPTEDIASKLRETSPWYSAMLCCIPWFARVRSWPESTLRIAWRGWMTGILSWVLIGIPWCYVLFAMNRRTPGELVTLWFLMATWGIVFLVSIVGMIGSIHGVYGQPKSTGRAVTWAIAGCFGQLIVYRLIHMYVNPAMSWGTYAIPFAVPIALFVASHTRGFTKLVRREAQRSERTGQWERLRLDEPLS